ncbi:MAG: O-acetyl-ADP-ribose deacetylase [Actinobacteria bacterium]|nr:O-acetyl-ADP-ribose deacetylase [Actinomycetota bacterium]
MPQIEVVLGNITKQEVDAIVNAANSGMLGGGGVDGAILQAGGDEQLADRQRVHDESFPDGLPTGKAAATIAGGSLKAKWVIHTVGPVYSRGEDRSALLASCHTEALRVADGLDARSIAFPAISTGVFGYPPHEAAPVAVAAVRTAQTKVELVRFVVFDQTLEEYFRQALGAGA